MADKLLIDAHYNEETRIAIIDDEGKLNNFETEYSDKKLIKGNIYLARIDRVESSLQAAFIDYGDDKHGFLPFLEIQSEYYNKQNSAKNAEEDQTKEQKFPKIQDVIAYNQVVLVQAIREKRGNKCAAFSTYLSLPGKYCVLVSNSNGKSGGISKKIDTADKERLREIISSLDVPDGLGVIIRTAGENRTKQEIKRDFEYLIRLWNEIKEKVVSSNAPILIHEEGNIIKRTIRDLYNRDMDGIIVQGAEAYKEARTFMKTFTPSHCKKIQLYQGTDVPIFCKYDIEEKIRRILDTTVILPSGGSIVINATEALTAIDVNSGRMKQERDIDITALKTNLEAASEIARQIQLRDIAGLIVIDFIDMTDNSAVAKVEKKFKECIAGDYSNINIGKISQFGLLEVSRQRLRQSLADANFSTCKHCNGAGRVLSNETVAMSVIRQIEGFLAGADAKELIVEVSNGIDLFILNQKRNILIEVEKQHDVSIEVVNNHSLSSSECKIIIKEFRQQAKTPESAPTSKAAIMQVMHPHQKVKPVQQENETITETAPEAEEAEKTQAISKNKRRRIKKQQQKKNITATDSQDDSPIITSQDSQGPTTSTSEQVTLSTTVQAPISKNKRRRVNKKKVPVAVNETVSHPNDDKFISNTTAESAVINTTAKISVTHQPRGVVETLDADGATAVTQTVKKRRRRRRPQSSSSPTQQTAQVVTEKKEVAKISTTHDDKKSGWLKKIFS